MIIRFRRLQYLHTVASAGETRYSCFATNFTVYHFAVTHFADFVYYILRNMIHSAQNTTRTLIIRVIDSCWVGFNHWRWKYWQTVKYGGFRITSSLCSLFEGEWRKGSQKMRHCYSSRQLTCIHFQNAHKHTKLRRLALCAFILSHHHKWGSSAMITS